MYLSSDWSSSLNSLLRLRGISLCDADNLAPAEISYPIQIHRLQKYNEMNKQINKQTENN